MMTDSSSGLSKEEGRERLGGGGLQRTALVRSVGGLLAQRGEVLREPMFLLLLACGAHLPRCSATCSEALMLLGVRRSSSSAITLYQERKTERALEALRDLSSPRALVIRDGEQQRIAGREVVRGDLLVLLPKATACRPTRVLLSLRQPRASTSRC